jgi:hypothetical protein
MIICVILNQFLVTLEESYLGLGFNISQTQNAFAEFRSNLGPGEEEQEDEILQEGLDVPIVVASNNKNIQKINTIILDMVDKIKNVQKENELNKDQERLFSLVGFYASQYLRN